MTVYHPAGSSSAALAAHPCFPQVLCLPEQHTLPGGELLLFRFGNGYGAAVTRVDGRADRSEGACPADAGAEHWTFEFCVLDCTLTPPQPTVATPVAPQPLGEQTHAQVAELLAQIGRLPAHPTLERANTALQNLEF
ncbi:hypothetical protein [Deinococcus aerophilus]|uniref:Uncharacterized protein n=1 Tax=Deinococcus aerophilus TaxID=522488 RepID=A0ABQ2GYP7_9DEIO|nr:hypothetical protein [Deinococcus aerophilus]GGM20384.1 hypothetical protein GCM10010841_30460 [Deinococcus aerophilus]